MESGFQNKQRTLQTNSNVSQDVQFTGHLSINDGCNLQGSD